MMKNSLVYLKDSVRRNEKGGIMPLKGTVKRVCDTCFDGNAEVMRIHAEKYLRDEKVVSLGREFRRIVLSQNRHRWWKRALTAIHTHSEGEKILIKNEGHFTPANIDPRFSQSATINFYRTYSKQLVIYIDKNKQDSPGQRWKRVGRPVILHDSEKAVKYLQELLKEWGDKLK